jgi:hypothetical protein
MAKKSFLLRINQDLWKELEAWAADEFRSVNGQIEFILKRAALTRRGGVKERWDHTNAKEGDE